MYSLNSLSRDVLPTRDSCVAMRQKRFEDKTAPCFLRLENIERYICRKDIERLLQSNFHVDKW